MYVVICMHQHVCMFIHSPYIYTSVFIMRVDTWIQYVCSYVCRYLQASTCMYVYAFSIYIHICNYYESGYVHTKCMLVCMYVCRYLRASTCMYLHTFSTYIHICIYYESGYKLFLTMCSYVCRYIRALMYVHT